MLDFVSVEVVVFCSGVVDSGDFSNVDVSIAAVVVVVVVVVVEAWRLELTRRSP